MIDVLGKVLTEIRGDPTVAAITTRVRGGEPATGDTPPMVILTRDSVRRVGRTQLQEVVLLARCYGTTRIQAAQLYGAVSDAIHVQGPRTDASGRAVFLSLDEGGGGADTDPDTKWPLEVAVINVVASAQALT